MNNTDSNPSQNLKIFPDSIIEIGERAGNLSNWQDYFAKPLLLATAYRKYNLLAMSPITNVKGNFRGMVIFRKARIILEGEIRIPIVNIKVGAFETTGKILLWSEVASEYAKQCNRIINSNADPTNIAGALLMAAPAVFLKKIAPITALKDGIQLGNIGMSALIASGARLAGNESLAISAEASAISINAQIDHVYDQVFDGEAWWRTVRLIVRENLTPNLSTRKST